MRTTDREQHFSYFKMSVHRFDNLLCLIKPFIHHHRTHRYPVSSQDRLAVTVRMWGWMMTRRSTTAGIQGPAGWLRTALASKNSSPNVSHTKLLARLNGLLVTRKKCLKIVGGVHLWKRLTFEPFSLTCSGRFWCVTTTIMSAQGFSFSLVDVPGTGSIFFLVKGHFRSEGMFKCLGPWKKKQTNNNNKKNLRNSCPGQLSFLFHLIFCYWSL